MKKFFILAIVMLVVFSLILVSCDNNPAANKTEETETKSQQTKLDNTMTALLKNQYTKLLTAFGQIEEIANKKSEEDYTENIEFDIRREGDEPLTLISNGDLANSKEGKTYSDDTTLYRTVTNESNETGGTGEEADTGSATEYEYITLGVKYGNVVVDDKSSFSPLEKTITFKEYGEDKSEQIGSTITKTDTVDYYSTSVYKEILALLNLYCPEDGKLTLSNNAISAVLNIVGQSPVIHIEQDFGTTGEDDKRVVLNADFFLSADNGSILISLESAEISIVSNKDNTSNRMFSIVTPEESELVLTLEDDFRLGVKITRTDGIFELSVEEDYITGRAVLSFSDLKVDAVWDADNQGGASVYSLGLDGSVSYNFTSGDIKAAVTVTENSNPLFPIEALVSFEGNTKAAEESGDWATFMKGFKIKSFKFGSYDISPDSISELISSYSAEIMQFLSSLFPEDEDSSEEITGEDTAVSGPSAL